jgi:hypothetical protein
MILSSAFSINMLPTSLVSEAVFKPVPLEFARELVAEKGVAKNMVNPRHESTAVLSEHLCGQPAEGGFLSITGEEAEVEILVMLPPRSMMSRSGAEVEIGHLEECQFFLVTVS